MSGFRYEYKDLKCENCGESFDSKTRDKKAKFCSLECACKNKKGKIPPNFLEFQKKGQEKVRTMTGEKHWNFGKRRSEEVRQKISKNRKGISAYWLKGKEKTEEIKEKISKSRTGIMMGEDNHQWRGGLSFEPYSPEFTNKLKSIIRQRDNFICQECQYSEEQLGYKLGIHHIDYNKKNNNLDNLISLCRSCHSKTNFKREDWIKYFINKQLKPIKQI